MLLESVNHTKIALESYILPDAQLETTVLLEQKQRGSSHVLLVPSVINQDLRNTQIVPLARPGSSVDQLVW